MGAKLLFNYFKHVPDDLVINSPAGRVISLVGTLLMLVLFVCEVQAYLKVNVATTLVVDELNDEVLRANFNITLHQVPCDFLSLDVSDLTGTSRHNITKDILKWRLDSEQRPFSMATTAHTTGHVGEQHENHDLFFEEQDDYEPPDATLSQPLSEDSFAPFLAQHELTVVNFFAPWCIWCRRLEPIYLDAAHHIPDLHFHGHARLSQVGRASNRGGHARAPHPQRP